jgi:2-keto-4-pentenoate hydratase/2-oxohepta-3-ene-1,7-dioic acid hydratase in catechol pathway
MAPGFIASFTLGLDSPHARSGGTEEKGLPWEKAKAFDGSAVLGDVELPMAASTDPQRFAIEAAKMARACRKAPRRT